MGRGEAKQELIHNCDTEWVQRVLTQGGLRDRDLFSKLTRGCDTGGLLQTLVVTQNEISGSRQDFVTGVKGWRCRTVGYGRRT